MEIQPLTPNRLGNFGLDVGAVEDYDLARALAQGVELPAWAAMWQDTGHRLVFRVFDQVGVVKGLRARRVSSEKDPESLAHVGPAVGCVMADPLGRLLLRQGRAPDFWPKAAALRVVVAEGEMSFLGWAANFSDADTTAPAVLGVVDGAWTTGIAARIPEGARVIVRASAGAAGERFTRDIYESLHARCTVLRGGLRGAA